MNLDADPTVCAEAPASAPQPAPQLAPETAPSSTPSHQRRKPRHTKARNPPPAQAGAAAALAPPVTPAPLLLTPHTLQRMLRDLVHAVLAREHQLSLIEPHGRPARWHRLHIAEDKPWLHDLPDPVRLRIAHSVERLFRCEALCATDLMLRADTLRELAQRVEQLRAYGAGGLDFSATGARWPAPPEVRTEESLGVETNAWVDTLGELFERLEFQPRRVLCLVPIGHATPLVWGALLPQALALPVVEADWTTVPVPRQGDIVVGDTMQWWALARSTRQFMTSVFGVNLSEPVDDRLGERLAASGLHLHDIYSLPGVGGVAWRDWGGSHHQLREPLSLIPGSGNSVVLHHPMPDGQGMLAPLPPQISSAGPNRFKVRPEPLSVEALGRAARSFPGVRHLRVDAQPEPTGAQLSLLVEVEHLPAFDFTGFEAFLHEHRPPTAWVARLHYAQSAAG